ncbi:MAG: response regulator transcription factor [Nitrospirae bacterium]|nr:response regulator transcription factor [Nitrospirota bacterium]
MHPGKEKNKKIEYKIFIVDDHPIVREGLTKLINQQRDLKVCGEAGDAKSALQAIENCQPDIAIVDISLGQSSGLQLLRDLLNKNAKLSILVLSMHDELVYAERCLSAGAKGYIMKEEPPKKVIAALKTILNGEIYISDNLATILVKKFVNKKPKDQSSPIESLSNRELEVFQLIGEGFKTRNVAEKLNLSVNTVESHIEHIKKKMNFNSSRDLFLHAVKWSMMDPSRAHHFS